MNKRIKAFLRGFQNGMKGYNEPDVRHQRTTEAIPPNGTGSALTNDDVYGSDVCPKCRSLKVGEAPTSVVRESKQLPTFTILGYQMCHDCKHVWERRVPMWAWYIGLSSGVGLSVVSLLLVAAQFTWNTCFFLFVSGAIVVGSIGGIGREKKRRRTG
jgi:hypothetical protein